MVDMKSLLTMQGMMFTMLLVGVFIRRKGIVTSEGRKSLTNLLVNLILPCNILYAFSKSDTSAFGSMVIVIIMSALIQLTWYILSKFLWKNMDDSRRGSVRRAGTGICFRVPASCADFHVERRVRMLSGGRGQFFENLEKNNHTPLCIGDHHRRGMDVFPPGEAAGFPV